MSTIVINVELNPVHPFHVAKTQATVLLYKTVLTKIPFEREEHIFEPMKNKFAVGLSMHYLSLS